MKYILISILFCSHVAFGIPIVNENVANSQIITVYPDHSDPNRFYIAPNVLTIARDSEDKLVFAYSEYVDGAGKHGLIRLNH